MFDKEADADQHEYLHRLHSGEDPTFNAWYESARKKYMDMLEVAEQYPEIEE